MGHRVIWSKMFCTGAPDELVPGGHILELLCYCFVVGQGPILQIGDDGVHPPQ